MQFGGIAMKRLWTILVLTVWMAGCGSPAPEPSVVDEGPEENLQGSTTAPAARLAATSATATVVFQGLTAFVAESGDKPLTALFIDADRKPPVQGKDLPDVVATVTDQLYLPAHEPYVGWPAGEVVVSQDCFFGNGSPEQFNVYSREDAGYIKIVAHKLCGNGVCSKKMTLQFGTAVETPQVDLEALVDKGDLTECGDLYFKLDDAKLDDEVLTVMGITNARTVNAKTVPNKDGTIPVFGYKVLAGSEEHPQGKCHDISGGNQEFAEEVVTSGDAPIRFETDSGDCEITARNPAKPLRVWLFNVHPGSYTDSQNGDPEPHHEVFYWIHDVAPEACRATNGVNEYPRPCQVRVGNGGAIGIDPPLGDPKCPIALLEWGD